MVSKLLGSGIQPKKIKEQTVGTTLLQLLLTMFINTDCLHIKHPTQNTRCLYFEALGA